ncbi:MAG: ATP-binding cassette domain-containing protein [Actinobacteria bacterium]|nr:ATP-binding cassette domain-containing protein [Actinomycetota bacterium]
MANGHISALEKVGPSARRWLAAALAGLAALAIASATLPNGLPVGVILLGVVLGALSSLTAMGLVLIYRSARVVNFAQVEIGGLAATVAVILVAGVGLPYFAALPIGLIAAVATGAAIEISVVRRFFNAPRLILTVATIGVAQLLGAAELGLPSLVPHLSSLASFTTPFNFTFHVGPIVFNGNHVVVVVVVPLVVVGLWWFFGRTDLGIAIRGAADSTERASLLGIPVRRLSLATWMTAAGLSGLASMLSAPILGPQLGVLAGPEMLLAPLAAAVVGQMTSLPVTFAASIAIGVFEQAVFWSYPNSAFVDVALFALVLLALVVAKPRATRVDDSGMGSYVAFREVRPVPAVLKALPELRVAKLAGVLVLAGVVVALPVAFGSPKLILASYMAIYAVIAVSLVVLTGWAGQISLGQFAFAGVGAATTAALLVHTGADLFVGILASAGVGALCAVVVGIPALRVQGLFLAVVTLAFAVPVSEYLLNSAYFPALTPSFLPRPYLFGRISLGSPAVFYWFCIFILAISYLLARNFRRSRAGRAVVAARDNERGAAAYSISPKRARMTAFGLSGALAGMAGALYAIGLEGISFSGFNPEKSLVVFTMVVVGGLGSLPGALLGAIYVEGAQYFLSGAAQLLATGAGLLALLMVAPAGLGQLVYGIRDYTLKALAKKKGLSVPSLFGQQAFVEDHFSQSASTPTPNGSALADESDLRALLAQDGAMQAKAGSKGAVLAEIPGPQGGDGRASMLTCSGVDASYGMVQVLFGIELNVDHGEILALLGTNGAGKSTVLKAISGLVSPEQGKVIFDGQDITKLSPQQRVKAGLVLVPGGRGVFGSLTVAENLRLAGWLRRKDHQDLAEHTLEMLRLFPSLSSQLSTRASDLSGGQQQMLTIAQALLCQPKLMMVDELSLGLAPAVVAELIAVVRELAEKGTTVVVVEQSLNVATALAERAVFMERGQVRFSGPTAQLKERPELARSIFLRSGARKTSNASSLLDRNVPYGPIEGPVGHKELGVPSRPSSSHPEPAAFEVMEATLHFGGVAALDGVSFYANKGEIVGIIGANGAGKTTLFDLCSGFLSSPSALVALGGQDITALPAFLRFEHGLGRMFQDARLFPSMTVKEALAVGFDRHVRVREPIACILGLGASLDSEAELKAHVEDLISAMGLERYQDAFISELSTGTRRIVELAGAMAHRPQVLLLDEPSSGIAQRESEALAELILAFREQTGATMVVIEHDIPLISSIADRLICMHLGQVISEGSPEKVLADPMVVSSYLGTDEVAIARSGPAMEPIG